jgi:hypothetical protein
MNIDPRENPSTDTPGAQSVARRREALRRIGLLSAAAGGAATPMAALATTTPRKWCYDKTKTKKVQSSVSGMNSIMMSAQPADEHFGKNCGGYGSSTNLPSACSTNPKFRDLFSCVDGSKDSAGVTYNPWDSSNGCLFHKRVTTLCGSLGTTAEAGWATAYCNSAALYSQGKFPYSTTQVTGFWGDITKRPSAQTFFRDYMENA